MQYTEVQCTGWEQWVLYFGPFCVGWLIGLKAIHPRRVQNTTRNIIDSEHNFYSWYQTSYMFRLSGWSQDWQDWQSRYNEILRRVCLAIVAVKKKTVSVTHSECVSMALVVRHAKRIRRVILSSVACLAAPYFSTLSHKRHGFDKTLWNMKCVFWLSLRYLSEIFLILRVIQRDAIINVRSSSCQVPVIRVTNWMKIDFFWQIFEKCWNFRIYENMFRGSWVVPCGRSERQKDGQTWRS